MVFGFARVRIKGIRISEGLLYKVETVYCMKLKQGAFPFWKICHSTLVYLLDAYISMYYTYMQASGEAQYTDDYPHQPNELSAAFVLSKIVSKFCSIAQFC